MLNNIEISKYTNTNSYIHKLNTLNKILTLILFLIITMFITNIYIHLVIIIYLFILLLISKIDIKKYLSSLKTTLYFLSAIFFINLLFKMNIITNIVNIFKILEMIIYSSLLTLTTSSSELIMGLNKLLSPLKIFKIKINEISYVLMLALKFIPLIIDQMNIIIKTLLSKGISLKTSKHKILILKSIIIPTINSSLRKADLLADTLILKSYDIDKEKTNARYNEWKLKDTIIILIYIACLFIVVWRCL